MKNFLILIKKLRKKTEDCYKSIRLLFDDIDDSSILVWENI